MNSIIKGIGITLSCILIASSCSEISFWDSFLGDQPESSSATTEEMFSSKIMIVKLDCTSCEIRMYIFCIFLSFRNKGILMPF